MKSDKNGPSYNERLFRGGIRRWLHEGRFRWLRRMVARYVRADSSYIELGCFDGKVLDWLPVRPARYVGLDANWEGGLDLARARWGQRADAYEFHEVTRPECLSVLGNERFECAIAMETLEHIPPELVEGYLRGVVERLDGVLLVTVPNELGLVFLSKWLVKTLILRCANKYSASEVFWATAGVAARVARDEHKGFDWRWIVAMIEKECEIVSVRAIPIRWLPKRLSFGVGIVAVPRRRLD